MTAGDLAADGGTRGATAAGLRRRTPASVARRLVRRARTFLRRRVLRTEGPVLLALVLVAVVMGLLFRAFPRWLTPSSLVFVILVGGVALGLRALVLLYVAVGLVLVFMAVDPVPVPVPPGSVLLLVVTATVVLVYARTRERLGVQGVRGAAMLVDLRDRLRAQGELPALPPGWGAEVVQRSAHGAPFSGDFLVAARSPDGRTLELALVDVSGNGVDAGTRALLLSGAFGGLLGAMAPEEFLGAANAYLLRQGWDEGFATAAHLVVDLPSGAFRVAVAGHPPAAQFHAGSGRWRVADVPEGPLLGVVPDAAYVPETGLLGRGDALLLYTDGLVEVPGQDLSVGIDRLLGEAERLVTRGFRDGARRLIGAVGAGEDDDRSLVVLWRT